MFRDSAAFVSVTAVIANRIVLVQRGRRGLPMTSSPGPLQKVGTNEGLLKIDNLAAAQYRNGNMKEAVELLRKALSIRELGAVDKNGIDILNNKNNLASALGRLKQYSEAEELFRAVLSAREAKLGSNHMDTLVTANYLGVIIKQQKKLVEAEEIILRALSGFKSLEDAGCPFSPVFAETNYNYAILCVQLGKRRKAGKHFRIAHEGLTKVLGMEDPHTLDALDWEIRCMSDAVFEDAGNLSGLNGADTSTVDEINEKNDKKIGEEDEGLNHIAGASDSERHNPKMTAANFAISKSIDTSCEEIYISRTEWVKGTQCGLCNQTFKVNSSPLILDAYVIY